MLEEGEVPLRGEEGGAEVPPAEVQVELWQQVLVEARELEVQETQFGHTIREEHEGLI